MSDDKKKILIIDDDPDIHSIVGMTLNKVGYQVHSALDAMQGPMKAKQAQPDLIILDIMMPAGGGVSVYNRLKQFNNTFQIPIVIYSAVSPDQVKEKLPNAEGATVMTKPASLDEIRQTVNRIVKGQ